MVKTAVLVGLMLFLSLCSYLCAQTIPKKSFVSNEAGAIMESVYEFDFVRGDSLIKSYQKTGKHDQWIALAKCNYYYWLIMSGEETEGNINLFSSSVQEALRYSAKKKEEQLDNKDHYTIINAYAFKSRLDLLKGNYLAGAAHLNSAVQSIKRTLSIETQYEAFKLTSGLYYYYIDYASKKYTLAKPIVALYPKGNMETGIKLLTEAAASNDFIVNNEGNYFLSKTYLDAEKNYPKAEYYTLLMYKRYPNNLIYLYNYFVALLRLEKKEEAQKYNIEITRLSISLPGLSKAQRTWFINHAKKQNEEYYKRQSEKKKKK